MKQDLLADTRGFSTAFDIFLFLVLVSVSALILFPAMTGNTQIKSALGSNSQKHSGDILLTLLNGRVDDFGYVVAGDQMDALAGPLNNTSVYAAGKKIIAGKELKHKTFSDIAAENAAVQWVIYYNGTRIQLNFLMSNYSDRSKITMKNYLDKQIGDRYDFNFTVVWRPFTGVPAGGNLEIGDRVPDNAYVESAYITMPYHTGPTRYRIEKIIEDNFNESEIGNLSFMLEELKNNETARQELENEISGTINDAVNDTIDESVDMIVNEKLAPLLDDARNKMIEDVNGILIEHEVPLNQEINDEINMTLDIVSANLTGTMSEKLKAFLKKASKEEFQAVYGDEIRSFTTELVDMYVNNAITVAEAKDRILSEVYSRININRAQATLSIWEKRKGTYA